MLVRMATPLIFLERSCNMNWNKISNKLPELNTEVLVYFSTTDTYIVAEYASDEEFGWLWQTLYHDYIVGPTDYWAYLTSPED